MKAYGSSQISNFDFYSGREVFGTDTCILLRRIDTLSGEATLSKFFSSLLKSVYTKRKEFAPFGSKFFPFRVDPFS